MWRSDGGDLSTFRSRTASLPHGGTERALTLQCAEGLQLLLLAPDTVRRTAALDALLSCPCSGPVSSLLLLVLMLMLMLWTLWHSDTSRSLAESAALLCRASSC